MKKNQQRGSFNPMRTCGCGCDAVQPETPLDGTRGTNAEKKVLNVDLLVIDLDTCKRCVPTGDQLRNAVRLLKPVAEQLGVDLRYREIVVRTREQAKAISLLSSPTIRLNGWDVDQDIRESVCESCGDLTENNTSVECREWHYRGRVFPSAPLPLLIEVITSAILNIDETPPVAAAPLEKLPENLQRYFDNRKQEKAGPSCCC